MENVLDNDLSFIANNLMALVGIFVVVVSWFVINHLNNKLAIKKEKRQFRIETLKLFVNYNASFHRLSDRLLAGSKPEDVLKKSKDKFIKAGNMLRLNLFFYGDLEEVEKFNDVEKGLLKSEKSSSDIEKVVIASSDLKRSLFNKTRKEFGLEKLSSDHFS